MHDTFHQRRTDLTAPDTSPKGGLTHTFTFRHSPQVNVAVSPECQTTESTAGGGHASSDFRIQDTRLISLHQPRSYAFGGSNQMVDLLSTLVIVHRCCLSRLQALLTLSHKYFSLFNRSTCALSVPHRYSGLRGIHLASSSCSQKQLYSWKTSTQEKTHRATRQVH